jgi:hypothetical protein
MRFMTDMRICIPHTLAGWGLVVFFSWVGVAARTLLAAPESTPPPREYEIKAAFIYNFTKFIEWPARSFPDAQSPFVIGVLGESPCAEALEQLVKDRKLNGRTIVVRRIAEAQALGRLQILFVGSAQEVEFETLLPTIATDPILTVGESPTFASMGGTINFVRQDDKVRLEINRRSAEQSGLKISAQLLKLATVVREEP